MEPLTLDANGVAALLGYTHRNGHPNGDTIRHLYRAGRFPPPIDSTLGVRRWRWSRRDVEQYIETGWAAA